MASPRSLAVFCGSGAGRNPDYRASAERLGQILANERVTLVFGAGDVGLMGAVATAALENGGRVVGVLPTALVHVEKPRGDLMEYYETRTMHERKALMYERSDAFCILPGGFGTLDETFEVLTWRAIGVMEKPIVFVNLNNYWGPLLAMIDAFIEEGFAAPQSRAMYNVVDSVDDVLPTVRRCLDVGMVDVPLPPELANVAE